MFFACKTDTIILFSCVLKVRQTINSGFCSLATAHLVTGASLQSAEHSRENTTADAIVGGNTSNQYCWSWLLVLSRARENITADAIVGKVRPPISAFSWTQKDGDQVSDCHELVKGF